MDFTFKISENIFEKKFIKHLTKHSSFVYKNFDKVFELRFFSFSNVILEEILEKKVKTINRWITSEIWNQVLFQIKQVGGTYLQAANKNAHEFLINGVKAKDKNGITQTIKLIDFENPNDNSFIVTNQFKISSTHPNDGLKIPDVVLFLNGLPVVVFELKGPSRDDVNIMQQAFQQMKNYQEFCQPLFVFNFFNVISNKHTNKYGTFTSSFARYAFWKNPENKKSNQEDPSKEFVKLLFEPKTFLNLVKNYIFFTDEEKTQKIIAGYHQFYGVEKTRKSVINGINSQDLKKKKAGIFWHTQGSGKSYSMVFLTKNVINVSRKITTLIITDRINLDNQIYSVFNKAKKYLGQKIQKMENIKMLLKELKGKRQNGIFFSTIQKFVNKLDLLSKRDDILIIADEAHRSHREFDWKSLSIEEDKDKNKHVVEKISYAMNLRKAFPFATFVGFTATPVERKDYSTKDVFGNYVSQYLMNDAAEDGFVVEINYDCREEKLQIDPEEMIEIDAQEATIQNQILQDSQIPKLAIKKYHKQIEKIEHVISDNNRIESIVKDFIRHYWERENILKGKAMFIAFNRKIAFKYYREIIRQEPRLIPKIKLIMTSNNQLDNEKELKLLNYAQDRQKAAKEFKDPDSNFKIAIVVDMWLTGFDVPCLDVIYIDKLIQKHNLMQAIARVNRVYSTKDKNNQEITKNYGLVVDYIGIWKKLEEALSFYLRNDTQKEGWVSIKEIRQLLIEDIQKIKQICLSGLNKIDYQKMCVDGHYRYELIQNILETVLKNNKVKLFVYQVKTLIKRISACLSVLKHQEKIETQILILARSQLIKQELGVINLESSVAKTKILIEKAIQHNKLSIHQTPQKISLKAIIQFILKNEMDKKYQHTSVNEQIFNTKKMIEKLHTINNIRSKKLSKKLQDLLQKYEANFASFPKLNLQHFFHKLQDFAKEALQAEDEAEKLGFTPAELAFYEIIRQDKFSQNQFDQEMIKKIAHEIFDKVKNKIDHSWYNSESMKQEVRSEIILTLFKYKYPPKNVEKLKRQLLLQLTEHIQMNTLSIKSDKLI